jgi:hypothetical protein
MSCHRAPTRRAQPEVPANVRGPDLSVRVGDQERHDVQELLGQALALGYLSMAEFEARLDLAATATTGADLSVLVDDLPTSELRRRDPGRRTARVAAARRGLRIHTVAYLGAALLMSLIWLAASISTAAWYPWPIWPLLAGGIGVLSHAIPVHAATRRSTLRL